MLNLVTTALPDWSLVSPTDYLASVRAGAETEAELLDADANRLATRLKAHGIVVARAVFGAADAARSDSLDRWTHFCSSTRKVLDGLLNRYAPRRDPMLVVWVRQNRPELLNDKGLATPLGRFAYALRAGLSDGGTFERARELADLYKRVAGGVHELDSDHGDLRAELSTLHELVFWFIATVTRSVN